MQMWPLGTQLSGGLGGAGRMIGLDDPGGLFQSELFCGKLNKLYRFVREV